MPKHLWFTDEDVQGLRTRIEAGEPTSNAIWRRAQACLAEGMPPRGKPPGWTPMTDLKAYITSCCIAALVTGDNAHAIEGRAALERLCEPWPTGDLEAGNRGLFAALVWECCVKSCAAEERLGLARMLVRLARAAREVEFHKGSPHDVRNNHWAVVHAGSMLAAMAAHGTARDETGHAWDLREDIEWARSRMEAFLMHFGDAGLYHEGIGYQMYPSSFLLPAVIASQRFDGRDLTERFPQLRRLAESWYILAMDREAPSDAAPYWGHGAKLSWNDDGCGWLQSNASVLSVHLAPDHQKPALRWMYDRLAGVEGPELFGPEYAGWLFALLYYPYDHAPAAPSGSLPRHVVDGRQGLSFFRNRYRDGEDAVFGAYARCTFAGGHKHDDAGSIRLSALGHDWIVGGGQARPDAQWQSVVTPASGRSGPYGYGRGAVIWDRATAHGGVFGMDLRDVSGGYAERWCGLDFSGASGSPVVLALLDQIDDHLGRAWRWNMTFWSDLDFRPHEDEAGFDLVAEDGANLRARFFGTLPRNIRLRRMPDSQRTFEDGTTVEYRGRPYIEAHFDPADRHGIYVVMAVQPGDAPEIERGEGVSVRVGSWAWRRPFGAGVPERYEPGVSGGTCKYPAGVDGYRAAEDVK